MEWSIGIDIGGTKIAGGIVHRYGTVHKQMIIPTPSQGRDSVVKAILELISELQRLARVERKELCGIGIGSAGGVDFKQGVVRNAGNITGWRDVPLRQIVAAHSLLPVWVDNDSNLMALGELNFGAAIGFEEVICLTLGTGIGGGIITGGSLLRGAWNGAGELGHITTRSDGPSCICGSRGCLQLYASGKELPERYKEKYKAIHGENIGGKSLVTGKEVFSFKREGIPAAVQVIEEMLVALSYSLINLIHTFNPTLIIIGGGLIDHEKWICSEVERRIKQQGLKSFVQAVSVVPAQLGSSAGLIGAAALPFQYHLKQSV